MQRSTNPSTRKNNPASESDESVKPGSSAQGAAKVGGDGDFGVPAGTRSTERDYVSRNTKMSDPGAAQPMDFEKDGVRDHGAGGRAVGPGSNSGGDIDTSIIGVGQGGSGVASTGPTTLDRQPGDQRADETTLGADGPHQGKMVTRIPKVKGSVIAGGSDQPAGDSQGTDSVTNPAARDDDSFAGEISSGEARGEDN